MAVSPFSKPGYVSHVVADHSSMLAFIEKRFLSSETGSGDGNDGDEDGDQQQQRRATRVHLTLRDLYATTLEDLFDFDRTPSLNTPVPPPQDDSRCQQSSP
jgi:hypothetical protein